MAESATIRYGEFVQSIYDSINTNDGEFWCFPLFGKSRLFSKAGLTTTADDGDSLPAIGNAYRITRYIYCTVKGVAFWKSGTAWIGYIAESTKEEAQRLGRRDIVVAIRGTMDSGEWIKNFTATLSDFPFMQTPEKGAKVHTGFFSIYTYSDSGLTFGARSMRDQIFNELRRLLGVGDGTAPNLALPARITVTGHSLGGALATMVASDVGCNIAAGLRDVTVSAITFGSPRVGNAQFKTNTEMHTTFINRYRTLGDPTPLVPLAQWGFVHVGTELILDWAQSPYVSISIHAWFPFSFKCHNLELHMHVMAAQSNTDVICIYNSEQLEDLLPALPSEVSPYLSPDDLATYYITYLDEMATWEDEDRDLLKQELEDVKKYLKGDEPALVQYFKEIEYIGETYGHKKALLHATDSPFDKRDHSLLNKSNNILKANYLIPAEWLVHPNKDMVLDLVSHKWLPREKRPCDIPTPKNAEYN